MRSKLFAILAAMLCMIMLLPVSVFADEGQPAVITPAQTEAETIAEGAGTPAQIETQVQDENATSETEQQTEDVEPVSIPDDTQIYDPYPYEHHELTSDSVNGNYAKVIDDAGLFSDEEEKKLLEQISGLLEYGNMGIATNEEYNSDAAALARSKYIEMFGETSGTLFLIDMYNRRIQFFSGGSMYRTLSTAKTNEITDNIYTYATAGDYYTATSKAFEQVKIVLDGGHIVAPMRFATNAAFAIGITLIINFIIITVQRKKKASTVLTNALSADTKVYKSTVVQKVNSVMTSQKKRRHVESSGGGGGFSGGGGGGFSGGGGGHSF